MESSSSAQAGEANSPDLTDLSDLESWGRDNLDLKLLRGSKIKLPVQTNFEKKYYSRPSTSIISGLTLSSRAGYIQKCPFKGTLILECRGAEMVVWAPLAMHTSLAAREYVERLVAVSCCFEIY